MSCVLQTGDNTKWDAYIVTWTTNEKKEKLFDVDIDPWFSKIRLRPELFAVH